MDKIDALIKEWEETTPGLDVSAMGVVGRVIALSDLFVSETEKVLRDFGLSYKEFDVLATLYRQGKPYALPPGKLCEAVILSSGAMTSCMDRLEKKGLIGRNFDANGDRRIRLAFLTEEGKKNLEKAAPLRFSQATKAVSKLSVKERKTLEGLLKKLLGNDAK